MRAIGVVVAGVLLGASVAAAELSISYDQKLTNNGQVTTQKILVSGDRFRMESFVQGMHTVMIRNQDGVFSYIPETGMGMKLTGVDPSQEPVAGEYLSYLKDQNAKKLREETVQGTACDVYQYSDKGKTTTAWVWREKQFPVKFEMQGPDGLMVAELTNIQFGAPAPAAAFTLPANVQMMDMGSLDFRKMLGQ